MNPRMPFFAFSLFLISAMASVTALAGGPSCAPGYCLDSDGGGCHACALRTDGALCPPDECNVYDGCTEGCTTDQLTCSSESDAQCTGKAFSTPCRWQVGHESGPGYCYPGTSDGPARCSCG